MSYDKLIKCRDCSYQFDPSKEGNSRKRNVECAVLEIHILQDQRKNIKNI